MRIVWIINLRASSYGSAQGLVVQTDGVLRANAVYSHDMNGETYRDLLVNNSGEFGYDSSTIRKKTEISRELILEIIYLEVKYFDFQEYYLYH